MLNTKIPVRENTGNLEMLPKHREFCELKCFLRFKDIAIFAAKSLIIILEIINHGNCHRENVWLHRGKSGKTQGI